MPNRSQLINSNIGSPLQPSDVPAFENLIRDKALSSTDFPAIAPLITPAKSAMQMAQEKDAREARDGFLDYTKAAFRQDSPIDGAVASYVGSQFAPDPKFNIYLPEKWKQYTDGIPEEYHNAFANATSDVHAEFIRGRLFDKLSDLEKLGDLGFAGTAGRFALGFVDPSNLAIALGTGGFTALARGGATLLRQGNKIKVLNGAVGAALEAEQAASAAAASAAGKASKGAFAAGLASAGAQGYAFERFRQSVNFEDSQSDAVVAGLMSTAFASPFAFIHSREMRRVQDTAIKEMTLAKEVREHLETGKEVSPQAHEIADNLIKYQEQLLNDTGDGPAPKPYDAAAALRKRMNDGMAEQAQKAEIKALIERGQDTENLAANADTLEGPMQAALRKARLALGEKWDGPVNEKVDAVYSHLEAEKQRQMDEMIAKASAAGEYAAPPVVTKKEAKAKAKSKKQKVKDVQESAQSTERGQAENVDTPTTRPADVSPIRDSVDTSLADMIDETVFWPADDKGGVHVGTVTGITKTGKLRIETETGAIKTIDRADLHQDSALYQAPEANEMMSGSIGSAQASAVPVDLTAGSKYRFDIYAQLNKSENMQVRQLADTLIKDAVQKSDHYAQAQTASEMKKDYQRILGGNFHMEARSAFDDAKRKLGLNWWQARHHVEDFYKSAGRLARGDMDVLHEGHNSVISAELERVANAMRQVYSTMLEEAKKAGVKGAADVDPNEHYVNRVWDIPQITELALHMDERFGKGKGKEYLVDLIESALRIPVKVQPHAPLAANALSNRQVAESFLGAVKRLEHQHAANDLVFGAHDATVLRRELSNTGLSSREVEAIITTLFEEKTGTSDSANAPRLKFRFNLDEKTKIDLPDGTVLKLSDLLENDSRVLVDRYLNTMAGHTALAKHGITDKNAWAARIREVTQDHETNGFTRDGKKFANELTVLQDMYDHITGRPMSTQSFNTADRVLGTVRALARASYLGQLGFTAALELTHAASLATFRSAWVHMPVLRGLVQQARAGMKPGEDLLKDIRLMTGFATEHAASYARQHELTDFSYDKSLTRFENFANRASHFTDAMSGNNFMTSWSRGLAAKFMVQKYADFATGAKKLDEKWIRRLVGNGIDRDNIDTVLAALKDHTEFDNGVVSGIKWEEWSAKDPDTYGQFRTAITREVRDAIQDHDIGETWHFQHSTVGKIMAELRSFSIAAHSKQFVKGLHYRDSQTMAVWMTSFVTQALGYVVQTAANFGHDSAELDKRLVAERIARASFYRMNVAGIAPMIFNSLVAVPFAPALSLSGSGMTANTDNRSLFTTPSMMLAGKALSTFQAIPQSVIYGENFTKKDLSNALSPIPNTYGIRTIIDAMGNSLPKSELRQVPN